MKKFILVTTLALLASNMFAQLTVYENGFMRLAHTRNVAPSSNVSIGGNGNANYLVGITSSSKYGLYSESSGKIDGWTYGVYGKAKNNDSKNVGILGDVTFASPMYYGHSYGVLGVASNAYSGYNYGVFGRLTGSENGTAIYGTIIDSDAYGLNTGDKYAGFFNGKVLIIGDLHVTGTSNLTNLQPGVTESSILSSSTIEDEDITNRLSMLSAQAFYYPNPSDILGYKDSAGNAPQLQNTELQVLERQHYGLDTEKLKEAFPELVYEHEDGSIGVNYTELIPVLVQAINSLKSEINELKGEKPASKAKANSVSTLSADEIQMAQNDPNPFNSTSTIELNIPASVNTAYLIIYDMNGKQLDKRLITDRGATTVTLNAADLYEGMFLYSLTCDGKVAATKRMIISK